MKRTPPASNQKSRKRKRLTLDVFGKRINVGCIPGPLHTDVRTMLLKYCRAAKERGRHASISLKEERTEKLERELHENGEDIKSLNDLRNTVEHLYNSFSVSAESIDAYYSAKRANGYDKVCAVPQHTMSKRCVELSGKVKKHALVLDVACGSGLSSDTFSKEYGFGVIGCDVSAGMLSKASKERKAIDYVRTDMSQPMPFRSNIFDTAFSVSAIHYLAEDVTTRSGKARMSMFFRELRRTTSTNAEITCQFHEKKGKETTHKDLQNAAKRESWSAADLVLDHPHQTNAQRWFLCLSNNKRRKSVEKRCPTCWPKNGLCPLMYAEQCTTTLSTQHLNWLENNHAKFARRLIRCVNRHIEAPEHKYLPKLSEEEKKLGHELRDRFGSSVDMKTLLQSERLRELIVFLHTYL